MIPLRDNVPTRTFPVMTVLLIGVNVLIFLLDQASRVTVEHIGYVHGLPVRVQDVVGGLSYRYAMIPGYVTGQIEHGMTPLYLQPAWLTIFTSMFLHANWLHVGGNMLYLWIFGNNIEDVLGRGRFLFFYLIAGIGAAALQIASGPASPIPNVGASGAIAGLMGAYLLLYPGAQILSIVPIFFISTLFEVPALVVIGYWFLIQVFNARLMGGGGMLTEGGVAYLAHIGGFVTGMLLILVFGGRRLLENTPPRVSYRRYDA